MLEDRLRQILADVNDWLKFAEAKNGAVAAANTAMVVGLLGASDEIYKVLRWAPLCSLVAAALLLLGALTALLSFLPRTQIPALAPRGHRPHTDNLLFFGDIVRYGPRHYIAAVRQHLSMEEGPLDGMLAEQIVINSRIAAWKYTCFKYALWATLLALASPGACAAVHLLTALATR